MPSLSSNNNAPPSNPPSNPPADDANANDYASDDNEQDEQPAEDDTGNEGAGGSRVPSESLLPEGSQHTLAEPLVISRIPENASTTESIPSGGTFSAPSSTSQLPAAGIPPLPKMEMNPDELAPFGPLARLVILTDSGTLPKPTDAWEAVHRLESRQRDVMVVSQDSVKSDYLFDYEGVHLRFTFATWEEGMIIRNIGDDIVRVNKWVGGAREPFFLGMYGQGALCTSPPGVSCLVAWKDGSKSSRTAQVYLLGQRYSVHRSLPAITHGTDKQYWAEHPILGSHAKETITVNTQVEFVRHTEVSKNTAKDSYQLTLGKTLYDSTHSRIVLGNHSALGRIAVKVIKPKKNTVDEESMDTQQRRWKREVRMLWYLDHPHIIKLIGCDSRLSCLYTPYVPCPPLVNMVSKHRHRFTGSSSDARRILRHMASALVFLEAKKMIHNNVKPGSILYGGAERGAILIDFGTATKHGDKVFDKGKCFYVPPEYYSPRNRQRGKEGDVFALGVNMLWLLDQIPLPDVNRSDRRFKPLYACEHEGKNRSLMKTWLDKVARARAKLDRTGIEGLVRDMLEASPAIRVSCTEVKQRSRGL